MRKSELFNAYLEGSLTIEQKEKLKAILRTEQGSEDFAKFMAESKTLCDLLDKREMTRSVTKTRRSAKKKTNINSFLFIIPALAACLTIVLFIIDPVKVESEFVYEDAHKPISIGETVVTRTPLKIFTQNNVSSTT